MIKNSVLGTAMAAGLFLMAAGPANAQSSIQFSNMHDFDTGVELAGAGSLTRSENQVWAQLSVSGLDKKAAYTMWWVFFNNPDNCVVPQQCGEVDLFVPAVEASIARAGGFITGTDGTANVTAHLDASDILGGNILGDGDVLVPGNGFGAEIHMIVRSHGKYVIGSVDQQIGSFDGACDVNICEDQQAIMFSAMP